MRATDALFVIPAADVLVLALDEVQRNNRDDSSDEDSPRAKRALC